MDNIELQALVAMVNRETGILAGERVMYGGRTFDPHTPAFVALENAIRTLQSVTPERSEESNG
jgi:hypothetical protein